MIPRLALSVLGNRQFRGVILPYPNRPLRNVLIVGLLIVTGNLTGGAVLTAEVPKETGRFEVTVVDQNGKPVEGANVLISGLRTKKEPGSHHGTQERYFAATNERGIAELTYPKYVYEKMETGTLSLTVTHPEFVKYYRDHELDSEEKEVTLDPGRRVRLKAVDSTGQRIKDRVFGLQPGYGENSHWKEFEDGRLISPPMKADVTSVLLVCLREGEPRLFSDLIDLGKQPEGDCDIGEVPMLLGRRIRGRISRDVPRPVKNGKVGIYLVLALKKRPPLEEMISWTDIARIREDGTFLFESVPRDTTVELVADCDDWVSASATADEMIETFRGAQNLEQAESWREIRVVAQQFTVDRLEPFEVEMVETAYCQFKVTDEEGKPVANARIEMYPNFTWSLGGNQVVGLYSKMSEWLGRSEEELREMRIKAWKEGTDFRYRTKTDENGEATISGLPGQRGITIHVEHDQYELAPDNGQLRRGTDVDLTSGDGFQLELKLQKKGTQLLGE